ncbi:hypothetical protein [Agilicoccus flavus]|uniref:hypothetical protein n=1 Tax=Agilicoccus flavus TaxID=2775968 RepID=UPI001CF69862|nr:hypothetical protein [Agilicoccus flavus]
MTLSIVALVLGVLAYGAAGARLSDGAKAAGGAFSSPAWWIGTGLQGLGFVCTLAARQHLPLLIVQACVVGGLAVTAIIQHVTGTRRIGSLDWTAIGAVSLGIVALAATTVTGPAVPITTAQLLVIGGGVAACALAFAVPLPPGVSGVFAGTGFAISAITARLLVADAVHEIWRFWAWPWTSWVAAFLLLGGLFLGQMHLTRGLAGAHAVAVLGTNYLTSTIVPAAIGWTMLGEHPRAGTTWLVVVGLALALAGALTLLRSEDEDPATPVAPGPV